MRLLRTIAALSAALTPLMAEAALSRPMPGTTDFPRASNPRVNVPVCYLETTSGTTFDLVSLCGSNAAPSTGRNATPAAGNGTNAPSNNPNAANPANPNPNGITTTDGVGTPTSTPAGTANPSNANNPNNSNPGTSPTTNPNNPNNSNNLNPGAAPYTTPNNLTPPSGTAGDGSDGVVPNPSINLPRVPPSSFGPGGVAPTRDAIDGQSR